MKPPQIGNPLSPTNMLTTLDPMRGVSKSGDIDGRIGRVHDEVGYFSCFDRTEIFIRSDHGGTDQRSRRDRFKRIYADIVDQRLYLIEN